VAASLEQQLTLNSMKLGRKPLIIAPIKSLGN
jgi:hypothetical protein